LKETIVGLLVMAFTIASLLLTGFIIHMLQDRFNINGAEIIVGFLGISIILGLAYAIGHHVLHGD